MKFTPGVNLPEVKTTDPEPLFPLWKFYTEKMFVLVRVELRSYVQTQTVKRFMHRKSYATYIRY